MKLNNFIDTGRIWPVFFVVALLLTSTCHARQPVIAIVIDDMGKRLSMGQRVIQLPGPVTCAFLPYAQHTAYLAREAHRQQKEIMLHQPMESVDRRPLDKGGVMLDMTQQEFTDVVRSNLAAVPYVSGVNNHMGSLLTRHPGHMQWLMQELQREGGLYFIDSRTTRETVARQLAREWGIPNTQRNVFLDNDNRPEAIERQFKRLVRDAQRRGTALAIGHPYRSTLNVLQQQLPRLVKQGIRLVAVSDLIRMQKEETPWQAFLSPSHRAVKSLKQ